MARDSLYNLVSELMKYHTALHFRTGLSLEELAAAIELQDADLDWENEDEWVIGNCDGVDKIDICRTHKLPPLETYTTVLRYAQGMDSVIPKEVITRIAQRLIASGAINMTVTGFDTWGVGFLNYPVAEELGL
jgi:hypothetical protein